MIAALFISGIALLVAAGILHRQSSNRRNEPPPYFQKVEVVAATGTTTDPQPGNENASTTTDKKTTQFGKQIETIKRGLRYGTGWPARIGLAVLIFLALWGYDEFGATLTGRGGEPKSSTMYPLTVALRRDSAECELLIPPVEDYPIWISIKDKRVSFESLDLLIVGKVNGKVKRPQKYNPHMGLVPDLNAYQWFKVVIGSKARKVPKDVKIHIIMDTSVVWQPRLASN